MSEIVEEEKKNRINTLDIAKGIGIMLVVWAHAKGIFSAYIYQFHMPFFFLISGYLYSKNSTLKRFILRKVKSLYIPFVVWNVLFIVLESTTGLTKYSNRGLLELVARVFLTLEKSGRFLGATWFLGALFVVSVCYKIMDKLICIPYKRVVITVIFLIAAMIGFMYDFKYMFSRTLILSAYYAIGVLIKEVVTDKEFFNQWWIALICFSVFAICGSFNSANMGQNEYTYPIVFFVGALLASYAFIFLSGIIDRKTKYCKNLFIYMGRNSLPILIWQFVAFRIVIIAQLYINHKPVTKLFKFFPVYDATHGWWLVYLIVGIAAPLVWDKFLKNDYWKNI